jgi:hypothetical protein
MRVVNQSVIDLQGALVGALNRRATHVAVTFAQVRLLMRGPMRGQPAPRVEAELRVWGGVIESAPRRLPRRLQDWVLTCRGVEYRRVLPIDLSVSGEPRLAIDFAQDEPLVVRGARVTLRVPRRLSQLAPEPRSGKARPARRSRHAAPRRARSTPRR